MAKAEETTKSKKVQVLADIKNKDLTAARNEYLFETPWLSKAMLPMLREQRDAPMLHLLINIVEVLVPGVCIVFGTNLWMPHLPLYTRHLIGLVYYLTILLTFQERFVLCIHFASHRNAFHSAALNNAIEMLYAPFFGIPPCIYKMHHVFMHHIENNHETDASSTEAFQRDSLVDFARYWVRFVVGPYYDLPMYAFGKAKRYSEGVKMLCGGLGWFSSLYLLASRVSFVATLWVFIIPHFFAMTTMAFGNWAQHIFVDPNNRHSNFALTYNCMDTAGNQTTFNDGYHIVHHLNARLHWSEMPQYFHDNVDKFHKQGAIVFRDVHFMDVGVLVMTGQLRKLVEQNFVFCGPKEEAPTVDEVEAKLRSWLKPVPQGDADPKKKA